MKVGIIKETAPNERRIALVPTSVSMLTKAGAEVLVEAKAGEAALAYDRDFEEAGARVLPDAVSVLGEADLVLKVQRPMYNEALGKHETDLMKPGTVVVTSFLPWTDADLVNRLVERRLTCFSLDLIPRISRAQPMDARSAMSTIAGYKAVLMAADAYTKLFPMLSTAAGTIAPAKALIWGVGVAGLQAIATARRLGAVVSAYDVRPAVKGEVESLGARFITLDITSEADASGYAKGLDSSEEARLREMMTRHVAESDIVITTALVPGRPAPLLITADMVSKMKPGSQIVDLAAEQGGNCELTKPGAPFTVHGVTIHGPINLPSEMPAQASHLYSRTITSFLMNMFKKGELLLDADDPIVRESYVTRDGQIIAESAKAGTQGS